LIDTLHQVVVVPTAAVQRAPDGTYVYVVKDDDTVGMRRVTVRQQDDQQAVIATGLMAQEQVVTTGFGRLADGTRVEVASAEGAGQAPPGQEQPNPRSGSPKGKGQGQQKGQNPKQGAIQGQGQPAQGAAASPSTSP